MDVDQDNPINQGRNGMLLKSILNRVQLHHGFVYGAARWSDRGKRLVLEIEIRARKGSRPTCSRCGKPGPGYDTAGGSVKSFSLFCFWQCLREVRLLQPLRVAG